MVVVVAVDRDGSGSVCVDNVRRPELWGIWSVGRVAKVHVVGRIHYV